MSLTVSTVIFSSAQHLLSMFLTDARFWTASDTKTYSCELIQETKCGYTKTISRAKFQETLSILVDLPNFKLTYAVWPASTICSKSGIHISKKDCQFKTRWLSDSIFQLNIKPTFIISRRNEGWCVNIYYPYPSLLWVQFLNRYVIIDGIWCLCSGQQIISYSKSSAIDTGFYRGFTKPKEGVVFLFDRVSFCKAGFL